MIFYIVLFATLIEFIVFINDTDYCIVLGINMKNTG